MTDDQKVIAGEFVNELLRIGALEHVPANEPLKATCPLFCLEKMGQPGQWRVIATCKTGGQNTVVGNDPVYFPRVSTILPHLYSGGVSATVDASKFFYQFPTVPAEREYLGIMHPQDDSVHLRYAGLPMGSGNSPACAGRLGASFTRKLMERYPDLFGGTPLANTWSSRAEANCYDTRLGHGRVLMGSDGLPAVLLWQHCDDWLIHGPTFEKTSAALSAFMDVAVEVGMLCNPAKTEPPSHRVKYCGFIYDTSSVPTLEIPPDKRDRALALVVYARTFHGRPFSRLCLAVVIGVLESLVPVTRSQVGRTMLRRLNDTLVRGADTSSPKAMYYSMVTLEDDAWADLDWWFTALTLNAHRPVRPKDASHLGVTWGDGSGTGTGGTREVLGTGVSDMWMGTWNPVVTSYTSNWKELNTLVLTLEHEHQEMLRTGSSPVSGHTLFYFTDNTTTYHAVTKGSSTSPKLHSLIRDIKFLELKLNCHLEVVHVPGVTMIDQGTDGLSRGVWISPMHQTRPTESLMAELFAPVSFSRGLWSWLRGTLFPELLELDHWVNIPWDSPWVGTDVLANATIWCPPPEMASQALEFILRAFVQLPHTTRAVILVPRIISRRFMNLSKSVLHLGTIRPRDFPAHLHIHRLHLCVLYVKPHTPSLPSGPSDDARLVSAPVPRDLLAWHRQQKELLRGL